VTRWGGGTLEEGRLEKTLRERRRKRGETASAAKENGPIERPRKARSFIEALEGLPRNENEKVTSKT